MDLDPSQYTQSEMVPLPCSSKKTKNTKTKTHKKQKTPHVRSDWKVLVVADHGLDVWRPGSKKH